MKQLAPADEELARDELAEALGIARGDIKHIRVLDWITGEVWFHDGRKPQGAFLKPDLPSPGPVP